MKQWSYVAAKGFSWGCHTPLRGWDDGMHGELEVLGVDTDTGHVYLELLGGLVDLGVPPPQGQ